MSGHDGPLGGAQVQHVGEQVTREQPIAPAAPGVERPRVGYHFSPRAPAAMRSPVRVRSGCTASISRASGATRLARPPVAITWGALPFGHSALMRRTRPSTTTGTTVVARSTASHKPCVTGGTTDATTAARTSWVERPAWARYDVRVDAHSSGVRCGVVVSRQWDSRLSPRNRPTLVSVLLMLIARSMELSYVAESRHGKTSRSDVDS